MAAAGQGEGDPSLKRPADIDHEDRSAKVARLAPHHGETICTMSSVQRLAEAEARRLSTRTKTVSRGKCDLAKSPTPPS